MSIEITIPQNFLAKLKEENKLHGSILKLTSNFSEWISENKIEFFPEYTDHGIDHINSVLKTADEIITPESHPLLTPQDIYVLITAIFLHDCAMHINRDGLWDLLSKDIYNGVSIGLTNETPWSEKWIDFCSEVQRFTDSDWNSFFGEYRTLKIPEIGATSLDDNQKIIIGDFIRRYHATISQIIVNNGIPSRQGPIQIFDQDFHYLNQLSGFIARSHNLSLRSAIDILGEDKKRTHRDTHPTFLMGVLRISDFMQFKAERTPKILFSTKGFCSPISISEWKKHLSILSTHNSHADEELLFVEAYPEDPITLISIKKLLSGFQRELDETWACLGEVYSRFPPLNSLALIYRRVRSNIDNPSNYVLQNHKSYHHEVLSIDTDNQKLFPLLIKPLYGNQPEIGLRELIQNAIDACNERYSHENKKESTYEEIPHSIKVEIDFDSLTLTVSDSGSGMNIDIIKNYFLKIGASYRSSEDWKSKFINNDKSYIPRTGKFGIGMLAGFLIGDRISVKTHHYTKAHQSLEFEYSITSGEIEIFFSASNSIGTSIKIFTSTEKLEELVKSFKEAELKKSGYWRKPNFGAWWYQFDSPKIEVIIVKSGIAESLKHPELIKKSDLKSIWKTISKTTTEGYHWRINPYKPCIYCNGIVIKKAKPPTVKIDAGLSYLETADLEISIFDNKGICPINLTRDNLLGTSFFEEHLLTTEIKNNLVKTTKENLSNYKFDKNKILKTVYDLEFLSGNFIPIVFTKEAPIPFPDDIFYKDLIIVDFLFSNQERGIIFSKNFNEILEGMAYSCIPYCEKNGDTVNSAISKFITCRKARSYDYLNNKEITSEAEIKTEGWILVKEFDFKKSNYQENDAIENAKYRTIKVDENWIAITNSHHAIPNKATEILNKIDKKIFIFGVYKIISATETEFSKIWKSC